MNDEQLAGWLAGKAFMVVEDVDTSRMLVSGLLRAFGATLVHTATDGEDALAKIERKGVPDIIICDWMMPKMDGVGLLSVVKQLYPATRFVMLTGKTEAEDVRTAAYLKVDAYLAKPFTKASLMAALVKLMTAEGAPNG